MNSITLLFALLAALVHVLIFLMESFWFMRPNVYSRFGVENADDAATNRLFVFNQGFYNLFLAITALVGICLIYLDGNFVVAQTLILSSCLSMSCAAVVLVFSAGKQLFRAAFIQAIFPTLACLSWLIL